ncbi:MAG: hypothetical protein FI734_03600 [SAR202 cluster bacterium]|nr:hypothetical protein [SAR202 cluster bacterium]|tara:strand:- start:1291 stop:1671 length:381 start_codon:yes stop_codon:yes gene_type:complete
MPQKYENEIEHILKQATGLDSSNFVKKKSLLVNKRPLYIRLGLLNFFRTKFALKIGILCLVIGIALHVTDQRFVAPLLTLGVIFLLVSYVLWFQKPTRLYQKKWRGQVIETTSNENHIAKLKRWLG